jgi:hypothetical protein
MKHSKITLLIFCVLILSACNYSSTDIPPTPSNNITTPEFTSTEPPATTPTETPSPPTSTITATPTLALNKLGVIVSILDHQYIVPFQPLPISTLLESQLDLSPEDIESLVNQYSSMYDVENLQSGVFYRLPEFDEEGNMIEAENETLEVRLGNYDRTETLKGFGEVPVYELGAGESIADLLILPLDDPADQDGYRFDIRRFNFNTGNVGAVYLDRENEIIDAPRNPLRIEILGYESMEDFMNAPEEEILNQIRLANAWAIDVTGYPGNTYLSVVIRDDGGEGIAPFILDRIKPTPEPSGGNGGDDGGDDCNPWHPGCPKPTSPPSTPHG